MKRIITYTLLMLLSLASYAQSTGKSARSKAKEEMETRALEEVTVKARRRRYSRKENPAVELMRKVIANKKRCDLHSRDFFRYTKYEKMTFALNDVDEASFDEGKYKSFAFVKDFVETSPVTGKRILPLTVDETLSDVLYRKSPKTEKILVRGESSKGVNELVNTGEILNTKLKDFFTDVDIYDEDCRLLQHPFKSPIANSAINFYRYYLQDTISIDGEKAVEVGFLPNNQQDFGFSGMLTILLTPDSSYQVRRVELNIPRSSDVNFVDNIVITQDFTQLPSGERIATVNDMLIEMNLTESHGNMHVQRVTRISDVSFDPIAPADFKRIKGSVAREAEATVRDEEFWQRNRQVQLTTSEAKMDSFLDRITHIKGFGWALFAFRAFVENFVETGDSIHPSRVDLGPVNTILTANHYDGMRFRISALTTANLHPHLFAKAYLARSARTQNTYGRMQLTYAFNRKAYLTHEFPQRNITLSYWNDIVSPFDKFVSSDKDNMFNALKSTKVDQYNHSREWSASYVYEHETGVRLTAHYAHTLSRPVDALFYQRLDGTATPQNDRSQWLTGITTSQLQAGISWEPRTTYINTKKNRIRVNRDSPVFTLSHTTGIKGMLGGEYDYNFTEAGFFNRFWIGTWGKMDVDLKAGAQWNKVPFPLLIHPAANTSFFIDDNCFMLISNLEFLNDRYASLLYSWDLNGKIFNRIPLLHKLKWREIIGFNMLWGTLTHRNDPASSAYSDSDLFYFPGHFLADGTYEQNTVTMSPRRPYLEWRFGIYNIFKFAEIDYVRRITYLHDPNTNRWGVRFKVKITF